MSTGVLFWAEGGARIGAGHLMRCAALAAAGRRLGLRPLLATRPAQIGALSEWRALAVEPVDFAPEDDGRGAREGLETLAQTHGAGLLVVDRYALSDDFWSAPRRSALALLDDEGERDVPVDLVINPNPGAERRFGDAYTKAGTRLLGAGYALIRPGIRALRPAPEDHVLVTLGGGDVSAEALRLAGTIAAACPATSVEVLCRDEAAQGDAPNLIRHAPGDLGPAMTRAAVMVCGGGVTALEAASLGVPMVILPRAANQLGGARALAEAGTAVLVRQEAEVPEAVRALLAAPSRLAAMSARARDLVDGRGAERAAAVLAALAGKAVAAREGGSCAES